MAKKKTSISGNYENEFSIIGIACHIPEYRIVYFLNQISNFNFSRYDDLMIVQKNDDHNLAFPFFYFEDSENSATFHLIANRAVEGFLINEWKQMDFLLIVFGSRKKPAIESIIKQIRKTPNVLAVTEMKITSKIGIDNLLTDIELHINEIHKKEKEKDKEIINKLRINRYRPLH
jgi:hypothetical protein